MLKNLYKRVKEDDLKEKIIFSVSQNRGSDGGKWLIDVALDSKEPLEMRKKALFWVGQNSGAFMDELAALYSRLVDRAMKDQLIFVYSHRRWRVDFAPGPPSHHLLSPRPADACSPAFAR